MCLALKNTVPPTETQRVYKIYEHTGRTYTSPYVYCLFDPEKNKEIVSNRKHPKATEEEILTGVINYGLHCFTLQADAERLWRLWEKNLDGVKYRVAVLSGKPEDFVGDGDFPPVKSAVYHKLTFSHWLDEEASRQSPKLE